MKTFIIKDRLTNLKHYIYARCTKKCICHRCSCFVAYENRLNVNHLSFRKGLKTFMKIITVTGYKPMEMGIFSEKDERIAFIKKAIEKKLIAKIDEGLEWIIVSGQMGVEMWTAQVALDLKDTYDIQIGIVPPFENQEKRWPEELQMYYQELTLTVDFFEHIYQGDYKG